MRQQKRDEEGLHLLTLIFQCAEAVSADNYDEATKMLLEISEFSTQIRPHTHYRNNQNHVAETALFLSAQNLNPSRRW
ncbi:hypothetical protein ACFX13_017891 [Malus domestica]